MADCPECGEPSERILSGGGGLLFKGEGFYITDYRSDSYKQAAKKESGGGEGASGASKGKSGDSGAGAGTSSTPSASD